MPNTIIATQLAVDPPLVMDANYKFNAADRRLIDDQIRAIEQLMVDNLINGKHGSWFNLSGDSEDVVAGDTVCLSSVPGLVTKTTDAAVVNSKSVLGVVYQAASAGGKVLVAIGGLLSPSITGLASGDSGYVRANTTTSRLEKVDGFTNSDLGVGTVDDAGWMQINVIVPPSFDSPTISGTVTHQGTLQRVISIPGEFVSIGAVSDVIAEFTMLDETTCRFDFTASMKAVGVVGKAGSWDGKVTYYRTGGGGPTIVGAAEYGTAFATTGGDGVTFALVGNIVKVFVTAADSDNRNWTCELRVQETSAA